MTHSKQNERVTNVTSDSRLSKASSVFSSATTLSLSNTGRNRILIVDDEKHVALMLQTGLQKLPGCEVVITTDSRQALQLFEHNPFDLLLVDYRMPNTDGLRLATDIQAHYPQTKIIMITAFIDQELYNQASDVGIKNVLTKPISIEQVRQVVSNTLNGPNP